MASTGQVDVKSVVALSQFPVDQGAKPIEPAAELLAEDGVEVVKYLYRIVVEDRRGT